ncbi:hypothetical protein AB0D85_20445, partial [Streptomyces sp. NPDC048277]
PDDSESVKSGSAGGREEKELPRQTPRHAADPTAWVMHARRLVRDHERLPESSEAMINLAAIRLMTRRLTRPTVHPTAARPRPGETVKAA